MRSLRGPRRHVVVGKQGLCVWGLLVWSLGWAQVPWPDVEPETGQWGYRLEETSWHIAPRYRAAGLFREGKAVVAQPATYYLSPEGMLYAGGGPRVPGTRLWHPQAILNAQGETVGMVPQGYEVPEGAVFGGGRIPARNPAGRYGYLNAQGEAVAPFRWAWAGSFVGGYALARIPDERLDSLFQTLSKPLQDTMTQRLRLWRQHPAFGAYRRQHPHGGLACCLITPRGEVVALLPTGAVLATGEGDTRLADGLFVAQDLFSGRKGLLDQEMRIALPFVYEQMGQPAEGAVFAVRRADRITQPLFGHAGHADPVDTTFVGFLDLAGEPVFSLPLGFIEGNCGYLPQGDAFEQGYAHIWLQPRYCEEIRRFRISRAGQLVLYQTWERK